MVDLSTKAIESSVEARGRGYKELINGMESCENWILDKQPEVLRGLINWATALKKADVEAYTSTNVDHLLILLGFSSTSRAMYLLNALEEMVPGTAERLLMKSVDIATSQSGTSIDIRHHQILKDRLLALYQTGVRGRQTE